ncbi:uncharacterized protein LOC120012645 [Tripterygium wilfordii]|uniref:uncharacterized protein LOC120012645 n=1 Tax=Tripterygium wilfordii TaxID=458696 RepID=UPI0018F80662|nr:uncharacterized protein LOC120012645 [Tripterygium wilfordii]
MAWLGLDKGGVKLEILFWDRLGFAWFGPVWLGLVQASMALSKGRRYLVKKRVYYVVNVVCIFSDKIFWEGISYDAWNGALWHSLQDRLSKGGSIKSQGEIYLKLYTSIGSFMNDKSSSS